MVYLATATLYYFGTKEGRVSKFFSIGALFTTILILLSSYLFGIYIENFGQYNKLYGSIGALLILMFYLWLNANILLLGFELNIMTKLNEDALQLVEQILPYFQPSFNITVDLVDQIGEKRDIPVVLDSINFTDDYEGDFTGRRILIYTLSFTAKSYMFGPVSESGDGLIRKVQVDYHTSTRKDAPREVRYTATPDPVDAEPTDDFGFSEETVVYFDSKVYSPTQGEDYIP